MSGGRDGCFKCGLDGHWARECPEDGDRRDGPRGGRGGFGRDRGGPGSRMDFRSGGGDKCYKCNRPGHFARECRLDQERCYKCNSLGHLARECSKEIDPGACYNCKSPGHVQRDCPEQSQRACFRCGENGHLARDCPEDPPSPIEKRKCYQCGENGHFVRECPDIPDGPKGGDRKCYGCGGVGHISRECPTAQRQAARDCFKRGGGPLRPLRERNLARRDGPYRRGDGPYRRSDDGPFRRSGGPYRWFASDRNRDSSRSPIRARARSVDWN